MKNHLEQNLKEINNQQSEQLDLFEEDIFKKSIIIIIIL